MASISQATHMGRNGMVADGVDALVRDFTRKAVSLQPAAGAAVVRHAARAAERMRDTVPIGPPELHVIDSITADKAPHMEPYSVYADAGPDPDAGEGAFVARFLENGTVHMSPRPFVGPTADWVLDGFEHDIENLGDL